MLILAEFLNHRSPHLYITSVSCLENFLKEMSKTGLSIILESQDMGTSTRAFLLPLELLPLDFDLGGSHHALFYTASCLKLALYHWWCDCHSLLQISWFKVLSSCLVTWKQCLEYSFIQNNLQCIRGIPLVKNNRQTCKRILSALTLKPLFIPSETDICLFCRV